MRALKGFLCIRGAVLVPSWARGAGDGLGAGQVAAWARAHARMPLPSVVAVLWQRAGSAHGQMIPVLLGCRKWLRSCHWLHLWRTSGSLITAAVVTWRRFQKGLLRRAEQGGQGGQSKTTMKQTTRREASPAMSWRTTGSGTGASLAGSPAKSHGFGGGASLPRVGGVTSFFANQAGFCYIFSPLVPFCNKDWCGGNVFIFKTLSMHPCKVTNLASAVYFYQ